MPDGDIMSFCSFSDECNGKNSTSVDNKFIRSYLPEATGDSVKVYLYGLYLCASGEDVSPDVFSGTLGMDKATVADCFRFWEEFGLVNVLSEDPLIVRYLPVEPISRRKPNAEKYTQFNKSLQILIPDRMITTNEYSAYFTLMENYSIRPEALLMIVKYCVDLKGTSIGFRYILKVAEDFANRGLTTPAKIEKELSDYNLRSGEIGEILKIVSPTKKAEVEDVALYDKWIKDYAFSPSDIAAAAKLSKAKSMAKLDRELAALFAAKKTSKKEIGEYYATRSKLTELARNVDRSLSVYVEVIDPVVDNYILPWTNRGYDGETLLFLANYCFRKNRRTLEDMNLLIEKLYKNGLVTLPSIAQYMKANSADDEFIRKLLSLAGIDRKIAEWDRTNLKTWRSWNFSDEMIEEAFRLTAGKNNPIPYVNAVLSAWKSDNVFSPDKIGKTRAPSAQSGGGFRSKNYTTEELDALIDDIDDIDL